MKIVFAAGGTGGHIMPALAIAEALRKKLPEDKCRIIFIGTGRELEAQLVGETDYRLVTMPFYPIVGKGILGIIRGALALPAAIGKALLFFRRENPDVIIGFGGYPSFVPALSAFFLRIPVILHEQNQQAGLANNLLSLVAKKIYATVGARGFIRALDVTYLSNPVRAVFHEINDYCLPTKNGEFCLVVVGGSQGAKTLNSAILRMIDVFRRYDMKVIHQTGERDYERVSKIYENSNYSNVTSVPFIKDIASVYASSHLVISRAGAMSVAEICAAGRPAIFVPLVIAGGHQEENVRLLVASGAAVAICQDDQLSIKLQEQVEALVSQPLILSEMADKARKMSRIGSTPSAGVIAEDIIRLCGGEL